MSDIEVARQFEQQILGQRAAFPCGCVLECCVHYPFKDWAYTGRAIHLCADHPYPVCRIQGEPPSSISAAGLMRRNFPTPLEGPLEMKWLKPDGTQVLLTELEVAMEEALDRLDAEEEARVTEMNVKRYRYGGIVGEYVEKEWLPSRASRIDPHIASHEGWHAIGRFGSVAVIPLGTSVQGFVHDEFELQMKLHKPGAFVELHRLQREHADHKLNNFSMLYGMNHPKLNRVTQPNVIDATLLHAQLLQTWPAPSYLKDSKGFEPEKPHTLEMTPRQIKTRMSAIYPDWDAKLLSGQLEKMKLDPPEPPPASSPDPSHDTLPSTLSEEALDQNKRGGEE